MRGEERFKRAISKLDEAGLIPAGNRMPRRVRRALAHTKVQCDQETLIDKADGTAYLKTCGRRVMAKNLDAHLWSEHRDQLEAEAEQEALDELEDAEVNTD